MLACYTVGLKLGQHVRRQHRRLEDLLQQVHGTDQDGEVETAPEVLQESRAHLGPKRFGPRSSLSLGKAW